MSRLIIAISFLLLVFSILGGVFYCWPKFQDFLYLRIELKGKDTEIKQKEEYFSKLDSLSSKMINYPEELAKINSALPIDPSIPALFNFMQVVSSENGLILENLTLGSISPLSEKGVNQISFNISVSGSYSAFKNLLSALYGNARMIDINSIGFSSNEEKDLFVFSIDLATYSYLEPKTKVEGPEGTELEN